MIIKRISGKIVLASALLVAATLESQSLKPSKLLEPPTDTWPMYNGDYSGRRFSTLTKINDSSIRSLSLVWVYRANVGGGGFGGSIKATPLLVDGVLYFTLPDHAWAIDARTSPGSPREEFTSVVAGLLPMATGSISRRPTAIWCR